MSASWRSNQISRLYVAISYLLSMRRGSSRPRSGCSPEVFGSKPFSSASPMVGDCGWFGAVDCVYPVHVSMACAQQLCCVGGPHRTSAKNPCTDVHFQYSVILSSFQTRPQSSFPHRLRASLTTEAHITRAPYWKSASLELCSAVVTPQWSSTYRRSASIYQLWVGILVSSTSYRHT